MSRLNAVALGGGHGLHASLTALRLLDADLTAVVTVADDGGSSGRIRRELGVLPPGDLRMALAALVDNPGGDRAGWLPLLQHRIGGSGALAGHSVGNLLLTGLMELHPDPVEALRILGQLVGARGRVLPMAPIPLDLVAEVATVDPDDPVRSRTIRGQTAVAATAGRVRSVRLVPDSPPACPEAVAAIRAADAVILGPGSWFTSVLPHLLVPELAAALIQTTARKLVLLNLEPQVGETDGFSPQDHLDVLRRHCPRLRPDIVIADSDAVPDVDRLAEFTAGIGAVLVTAPIAEPGNESRHDAGKLAAVISQALGARLLAAPVPRERAQQGVHQWL